MNTIQTFLGIGLAAFAIAMYFQKSLAWLISVIPWVMLAVTGYQQSVTDWDVFYFMFWAGVAMTVVSVMMALNTRSMEAEEDVVEKPKTDDADAYLAESENYGEGQAKIHKATKRRTPARSRR